MLCANNPELTVQQRAYSEASFSRMNQVRGSVLLSSGFRILRALESWRELRLIVLVVMFSICASLGQQLPPNATQVWKANLVPTLEPSLMSRYWEDRESAGITYLDNDRLILHHVHFDRGQLASRQSPDISSPFRLKTWLLNGRTGKPLLTREWGTRFSGTAIVVNRGGVIVRTGDTLRLLSSDFEELQKAPIQDKSPGTDDKTLDWDIHASATRQSVLVNHYQVDWLNKASLSQFHLLDGNTFEVKQEWKEDPALHDIAYSVSDTSIAYVKHDAKGDQIYVSDFASGNWKPLWRRSGESCYDSNAFALLANDSFVYACKEFSFVSDGKFLMREKFEKGERPVRAKLSISEDKRLAAISLSRIGFRKSDFKEVLSTLRIVVYDLVQKRCLQSVVISPLPSHYYDFALSPDGTKLAVLNDRTVTVYQLPRERNEMQVAEFSQK